MNELKMRWDEKLKPLNPIPWFNKKGKKTKWVLGVLAVIVLLLLVDEATSDIGIFTGSKGIAIYNCKDYLIKSNSGFEIIKARAVRNDTEVGMDTPPLTVFIVVRMQGPYGPKKGLASFACNKDGNIIQPTSWPDYFSVSQP